MPAIVHRARKERRRIHLLPRDAKCVNDMPQSKLSELLIYCMPPLRITHPFYPFMTHCSPGADRPTRRSSSASRRISKVVQCKWGPAGRHRARAVKVAIWQEQTARESWIASRSAVHLPASRMRQNINYLYGPLVQNCFLQPRSLVAMWLQTGGGGDKIVLLKRSQFLLFHPSIPRRRGARRVRNLAHHSRPRKKRRRR